MTEKRTTQIFIGIGFACALAITIITEVVGDIIDGHSFFSPWWYYPSLMMFLFISLATISNRHWALALQVVAMLVMSYVCLIVNGRDDFYSWGFLLLFVIMCWYYDLLKVHALAKSIAFVVSFLIASALSSCVHGDINILVTNTIYFGCVFSFLAFLFRKSIGKMLESESKVKSLESLLGSKERELEEVLEATSRKIDEYEIAIQNLQDELTASQKEYIRINETIKSTIASYNRRQAIKNDRVALEVAMRKLLSQANLKDMDFTMLAYFYASDGAMTNKEIGFEMGISETIVKNHFHQIMSALSIPSRSALYAYISSALDKELKN